MCWRNAKRLSEAAYHHAGSQQPGLSAPPRHFIINDARRQQGAMHPVANSRKGTNQGITPIFFSKMWFSFVANSRALTTSMTVGPSLTKNLGCIQNDARHRQSAQSINRPTPTCTRGAKITIQAGADQSRPATRNRYKLADPTNSPALSTRASEDSSLRDFLKTDLLRTTGGRRGPT